MAVIAVPKPLREKLGDEAVDSLVELLNMSEEKIKDNVISLSEEKYERRLSEEVAKLNKRITEETGKLDKRITEECSAIRVEMAELKAELKSDIAGVRSEFKVELKSTYANIIKWMFIFWIGQIGAILSILFAFFKT